MSDQDTLRVKSLEIVDEEGIPRIQMGVSPEGSVYIVLRDTQGRNRSSLLLKPDDNPMFSLLNESGNPLVTINTSGNYSTINLTDGSDRVQTALTHDTTGLNGLLVFDHKANLAGAVVSKEGVSEVFVQNEGGETRGFTLESRSEPEKNTPFDYLSDQNSRK